MTARVLPVGIQQSACCGPSNKQAARVTKAVKNEMASTGKALPAEFRTALSDRCRNDKTKTW